MGKSFVQLARAFGSCIRASILDPSQKSQRGFFGTRGWQTFLKVKSTFSERNNVCAAAPFSSLPV